MHPRRQTPHVDTSNNNNNKIFFVEMLSYRPSELEEPETHLCEFTHCSDGRETQKAIVKIEART